MSHNVLVEGVEFRDMAILKEAVDELAREHSINAALSVDHGKSQMRGYYGRRETVDAVIHLPDAPYDIGFKHADGVYTPYFESGFRPAGFCSVSTAKPVSQENTTGSFWHSASNIGQLVQRYSVRMAERNARRNNLRSRRLVDAATGQIRLEIQ